MKMSPRPNVSCMLCQQSEETETTGALSTKDQATAHQNCLLFSSGIFCRDSPLYDDLFGFSVDDVMKEVKRGSKLTCSKCKKKGATAGCEDGRCKKSYHYPCAVLDGAETFENEETGEYGLFCWKHNQQKNHNQGSSSVNGCASSVTKRRTSRSSSEAGPSKHASSSHKRNTNGDASAAGPSAYSSDSSSSSTKRVSCKRRFSFSDGQDMRSPKRQPGQWKKIIDESSDSDVGDPDTDIEMFAPLESDLEGSANSVPESQITTSPTQRQQTSKMKCWIKMCIFSFMWSLIIFSADSKATESPAGSTSENQQEDESKDGKKDEDGSDAESESLLPPVESSKDFQSLPVTNVATQTPSTANPSGIIVKVEEHVEGDGEGSNPEQSPVHSPEQSPVHSPDQHIAGPSVPQQSCEGPPPSPHHTTTRSVTSSANSPAPPDETVCVPPLASPAALPSDPEPSIHSSSFWKSCNAAGCTQAIFTDFINEMNVISSRIQSDQASQEEYDLALTVMEASGKLAEFVTKQQKELQRKQVELQKAAAAMEEVVSALRK
ncbi:uncharacterized protein phf11 [Chaetodon auriga]|uniref:uncharacterized protein phf11 n=1 Tax=Chaetodon auriga TaxID=39042 RepID=UPI004032CAFC